MGDVPFVEMHASMVAPVRLTGYGIAIDRSDDAEMARL
jgi:hypothetical protein